MNRRTFVKTFILSSGALLFNPPSFFASASDETYIKISMIYNNIGSSSNLRDNWGLSLWIENKDTAVIFDTGGDSSILWNNIENSGIDINKLSKIVISHNHWDHIGGLPSLLKKTQNDPDIFVPDVDLEIIKKTMPNARLHGVKEPTQIAQYIWSTGPLKGLIRGETIHEQSIIITQNNSSFLFTGCSHPGIVEIVKRARELHPENTLKLVGGGFHLMNTSEKEIITISTRLKRLHVENIAPSHCTGELALNIFKKEWEEHFINLNNGDNLDLQFFPA